MRRIQLFTVSFGTLLITIFLFSSLTSAQEIPPSYGFLEVIDYENKPVADAAVSSRLFSGEAKTDEQGQLANGIPIRPFEPYSFFTIKKDGYYTFTDYFGLFNFLPYSRDNKDKPIKIELLKIPENSAEKNAVGNEQLKREFFDAVINGDTVAVRKFIKSGLDPNLKTSELRGVPVLEDLPIIHYAAKSGNIETIKTLLAAGADIRQKDLPTAEILLTYLRSDRFTKRYAATENEKAEIERRLEEGFDLLVKAGANTKYADKNGDTAINIATAKGYTSIVKKLLNKGISADTKNVSGETVLMNFVADSRAWESYYLEMAKLLLASGADPNAVVSRDDACNTVLMKAVRAKQTELVKLLLKNKADMNFACKDGTTALTVAVEKQNAEIIDVLLDAGASVNVSDKYGRTPLMFAVNAGNIPLINSLISKGAKVNATDKRGVTALSYAIAPSPEVSLKIIKILFDAGLDLNPVKNNSGEYLRCDPILSNAAQYGLTDTIDLLISKGADVNLSCPGGNAPIVGAVRGGRPQIVKLLLDLGAKVQGEQGKSALFYAGENLKSNDPEIKANAEEIIKILEAAGAK